MTTQEEPGTVEDLPEGPAGRNTVLHRLHHVLSQLIEITQHPVHVLSALLQNIKKVFQNQATFHDF